MTDGGDEKSARSCASFGATDSSTLSSSSSGARATAEIRTSEISAMQVSWVWSWPEVHSCR
eukprot:6184974-Pleurochrysis_carterae.AAC.2